MTNIILTIRLEDSGSSVEPIVGPGWRYRVRNSLPYVNGGDLVEAAWPNGGGWKPFQSASVTLDLDPLPPENPYLLEVQRPGDVTSPDPQLRRPSVYRREFRQVLSSTANSTSWWNLTQVADPGAPGASLPEPLRAYVDAQLANLQAQISGLVVGGGGTTVDTIPGMSTDARTFNKAANYLAMRNLLLAAGTTTVDDLSVGDDATVNGDLAVSGTITNAGLTAALAGKAPTSAIPTWSTIGEKPTVVAAGADQAAARTAIGAAPLDSPALVNPTATTPAAGDNSGKVATTSFVQTELAAAGAVSITVDPSDPDILIVTVP